MRTVPFKQVDVFTSVPFRGNPVAVVLEAEGLSSAQMQQIARWTNLSETTFVLPPTAGGDYRLRIFTPATELPFAGHPTIGTAHALLEAGRVRAEDGRLVQECEAGRIRLAIAQGEGASRSISFELPTPTFSAVDDAAACELGALLGEPAAAIHAPLLVDVGPRWVVVQLPSADAVVALAPDFERMARQDVKERRTGVVVFGASTPDEVVRMEVRAFAPTHGAAEDPVCGSGNGCVAAFLQHTHQTDIFGPDYVASQGRCVGRSGLLRISIGTQISVGGESVTCVDGRIVLD